MHTLWLVEAPNWRTVSFLCVLLGACAAPATRQPPAASGAGLPGSPGNTPAATVSTAELFAPGSISDAREQWRITFSRDGRVAYFAASDAFFPVSRKATIYVSRFNGKEWSAPDTAAFSGKYSDMDPALSPDGRRLYFSSIRPVGGQTRGDLDIWMVEQTGRGWSEPIQLGTEVNTTDDELYPSISRDGSLYFASGPQDPAPGLHYDIFRAAPRGT